MFGACALPPGKRRLARLELYCTVVQRRRNGVLSLSQHPCRSLAHAQRVRASSVLLPHALQVSGRLLRRLSGNRRRPGISIRTCSYSSIIRPLCSVRIVDETFPVVFSSSLGSGAAAGTAVCEMRSDAGPLGHRREKDWGRGRGDKERGRRCSSVRGGLL